MTDPQKAEIRRLAAEGQSHRKIAEKVGVSHVTVGKVLKEPLPNALSQHLRNRPPATPPPEASEEPADDAPALVQVRYLVSEAREQIRKANAIGDSQLAQRQVRNAAYLSNVLARLEKVEAADSDLLRFSKREIDQAMASLLERVRAVCDRPLLCAECSRQLSVDLGTAGGRGGVGTETA